MKKNERNERERDTEIETEDGHNKNSKAECWEEKTKCRDENFQHKQQRTNRQQRAERIKKT